MHDKGDTFCTIFSIYTSFWRIMTPLMFSYKSSMDYYLNFTIIGLLHYLLDGTQGYHCGYCAHFLCIAAAYPHSYRRESYYGGNVARTNANDDMNEVATEDIDDCKL